MSRRTRAAVAGFAASAALLALGLGALTLAAVRSARAERTAQQQAGIEEDIRLALWRMDAAFAAFLAAENSRPVDRFTSSATSEEAETFLHQRFTLAPGGTPVEGDGPAPEWLALWAEETMDVAAAQEPRAVEVPNPPSAAERAPEERQDFAVQVALNTLEFNQRVQLGSQAESVQPPAASSDSAGSRSDGSDEIRQPLAAHWVGDHLVLRRRVIASGAPRDQITWLDWPRLREFLLAQTGGVFSEAALIPVADEGAADPGRRLALLPARLDPGPLAAPGAVPLPLGSPMGGALTAAWGAVILALLGVGALLWGSLRLNRRREEFVSAVTHELRTPLTTFRLQSEMLATGMVPESDRQRYAETLHREADRLGHLVDNVLTVSRLEKGRWPRPAPAPLAESLEPVLPLLAERAADASLRLAVDLPPQALAAVVCADRERLERILLNLVDNACKYAPESEPPEIELSGRLHGPHLELAVRDHGPGIPRGQRRKLFRPFHKSAEHATGGAPGVGLGLSLARRLARGLGGDLFLADPESGPGARFVLRVAAG